jgi:hypothetical protein
MNDKSPTRAALLWLVPTVTAWAIGAILESPSLKGKVMELDGRANKHRYDLERSLKRGVRNAKSNIPWLAAGAVVILVGVGLMANAARER